ncbi:MAG: MATE family efflux transporter [Lentisphaeria bacterium]|nr:MATE family efflux transporter [Lentisphaeria bacterium]
MHTSGNTRIIKDYTRGPLFGNLLAFSIPFMISNALQVVYAVVDMIVVGKVVGHEALVGVSNASEIITMLSLACTGLSAGGQIYISQLLGSGRRDRLNQVLGSFFALKLLLGAAIAVLVITTAAPCMILLRTPAESLEHAEMYMRINSLGLLFTFGYGMFAAAMRGLGDSRHPLAFIILSSVTNLVLDIWFVKYLRWGVAGAAWATVIAQFLKFVVSWIYLYIRRADLGFDFKWSSWRIDWSVAWGILKLGFPLAIRYGMIHFSMLFVRRSVNSLGVEYSAAFSVGLKCDSIVSTVSAGILTGASGIIGQNYGARKFVRIRRTVMYAWLVSAVMYALYTALLVCRSRWMFGRFVSDERVLALAPVFVSAILWQFPAMVLTRGTTAFVHGIGNVWLAFAFAMFDAFLLRILLSWLFGDVMFTGTPEQQLYGYILGYGLASWGMALPGLAYYLFGPWKKRKLVTE